MEENSMTGETQDLVSAADAAFGEANEAATGPEPSDSTATPEPESGAEQPAQDAEPVFVKIGDEEVPLDDVLSWKDDSHNMREMQKASTQNYQEAKRIQKEYEERVNSPEYQRFQTLTKVFEVNPELANAYEYAVALAENRISPQQVPQQYDPRLLQEAYARRQAEYQLESVRTQQAQAEAQSTVDRFMQDTGCTEEQAAELWAEVEQEIPVGAPGAERIDYGKYLRFKYHEKFGEQAMMAKLEGAKESARAEVVRAIKEGKEASVADVKPSEHREIPWQPDQTRTDFEESHQRALHDTSVWGDRPLY